MFAFDEAAFDFYFFIFPSDYYALCSRMFAFVEAAFYFCFFIFPSDYYALRSRMFAFVEAAFDFYLNTPSSHPQVK
jgi:hypothetical protein